MPDLVCDLDAALAFVEALTGHEDTPIVTQTYDDDQTRKASALSRVIIGPLREIFPRLAKLNQHGAAICIQVNAGGRGKYKVKRLRALFTDDDGKHREVPLRVTPSIQVQSSQGERMLHTYFLLREEDQERLDAFEGSQKALAAYYKTDAAVHNLDRVLRIPGFYNQKKDPAKGRDGTPFLVRMLFGDYDCDFSLDDLVKIHGGTVRAKSSRVLPDLEDAPSARTAKKDAKQQQAEVDAEDADNPPTKAALATAKRIELWLQSIPGRVDKWPFHEGAVTSEDVRRKSPTSFLLRHCPFNKDHVDSLMIEAIHSGAFWAGCWHDSCGGNRSIWKKLRNEIGGFGGDPREPFERADHVEFALRLLRDASVGATEPLIHADGDFWRYTPTIGIWDKLPEHQLGVMIGSYAGFPRGIDKDKVVVIKNTDRTGTLAFAQDYATRTAFFSEAPAGLSFANGFLNFSGLSAELLPHTAANRCRFVLPFDYSAEVNCPRWLSYLAWCFEGEPDADQKVAFLQEFMGATLVAEAWRYQIAALLIGEGSNGKSVFIDTLTALLPKHLVAAVKPEKFGNPYSLAALVGVRLNAVQEIPQADILAADSFKEVIDGKLIQARNPYEREVSFMPRLAMIMSANKLPGTVDHTYAFFRRFRVVEFNRLMAEVDADKTLADYLRDHERPGITAWAIEGANRLRLQGAYTNPPSSVAALASWRHEADVVSLFVNECTREDKTEGTTVDDLYVTFRLWLEKTGHRLLTRETFRGRLKALGIRGHRRDSDAHYMPLVCTANAPRGFIH